MGNLNNRQKGLINHAGQVQKIIFDTMHEPVIVIRRNYSSVSLCLPNNSKLSWEVLEPVVKYLDEKEINWELIIVTTTEFQIKLFL